jgi:cell division protease FtsH
MENNLLQKFLIGLCLIAALIIGIKTFNTDGSKNPEIKQQNVKVKPRISKSRMTYGRFLNYLEMGWVKQVDLYENSRHAIVKASSPELGNRPQSLRVEIPIGSSQLIEKLKEYNINFDAHPLPKQSLFEMIFTNFVLPLIFIIGFVFLLQKFTNFMQNFSGGPMDLGKSPARFDERPDTGITFDSIAGIDEAKAEFEEIVSFLKEPDRYTRVGAKIPKGVLLIGPPGTGKTLLAKAIASEADVPFYSIAGSEFVEMFIGIGAARVRDLFKKAAENTPCIIFIDEIDAVGRERGAGIGGGNDEREQTLNQLLTEMDGFKDNKGVIVVGATNRVDILDPALLRPGRFDRQIEIGLPDRLGRIGILQVHAQNKVFDEDVSLVQLATRTPGFSGADLANLLNESAILATRYKKTCITNKDVNEAVDRILGGIAGTTMEDTKNKKLIAYHEVGHAIIGSILPNHPEVEKITLVPRGGAKGLTWFTPNEDNQSLVSRSQLLARIISMIAGRVTEEVIFGEPEVTTGASNDLQRITRIARQMVTRYGMSNIGPVAMENKANRQMFANRINIEVSKIVNHCEKSAAKIILDNRILIDLAVDKLLEVETLEGEDFKKLIQQYTISASKITSEPIIYNNQL